MFQVAFDEEKKDNEQQEPDQNLIASFVKQLVQFGVFSVNPERGSCEHQYEYQGKRQLSV